MRPCTGTGFVKLWASTQLDYDRSLSRLYVRRNAARESPSAVKMRHSHIHPVSFRAVTFDLFDTLVEIDENNLPCLNVDGVSVPSLLGAPFDRLLELVPAIDLGEALVAYFQVGEELRKQLRHSDCELPPYAHFVECLKRVGVVDPDVVRAIVDSQRQVTLEAARPAEGTHSLLKQLRDQGCLLGVVSNFADGDAGRELLSRLKLLSYFDAVVFSGDVGWRKPNRLIFETTLTALNANAREVLHVGDELHADIWGAGHCGLPTVWLNPDGAPFTGAHPPLFEIARLSALTFANFTVVVNPKTRNHK